MFYFWETLRLSILDTSGGGTVWAMWASGPPTLLTVCRAWPTHFLLFLFCLSPLIIDFFQDWPTHFQNRSAAAAGLQWVQNSTARFVTRKRKFEHVTPILRLHWLMIRARIQFKVLTLVFKCLHGNAPAYYLSELIKQYQPSRNLRSQSKIFSLKYVWYPR